MGMDMGMDMGMGMGMGIGVFYSMLGYGVFTFPSFSYFHSISYYFFYFCFSLTSFY